jgi:predicted enzyme related to lactoylglutathione lyase
MDYIGELTCSMGVTDINQSLKWYQDVLDFTLLYHVEDIAWCEMSTGVAKVNVGLSQVETVPQGGGATLTWGVKDIVAAKASLDAKNVRMDGDIRHIPGLVKLITFYDPDGNAMMLFEAEAA